MLDGEQEIGDRRFALALQHAIDGAGPVLEEVARDEGRAVPADEEEAAGELLLGDLRQVDDLRHVRQVVAGEGDDVGSPVVESLRVVAMGLHLQVQQADVVAGLSGGLRDQLETERLQPKIDLRVHERTRMNEKYLHLPP